MNTIILAGRLAKKPEMRWTAHEKVPVSTLRLATKNNKRETIWHNVTVWTDQAELCCKYLEKGSKVVVNARIEYKTTTIHETTITIPEIVANHVEFL